MFCLGPYGMEHRGGPTVGLVLGLVVISVGWGLVRLPLILRKKTVEVTNRNILIQIGWRIVRIGGLLFGGVFIVVGLLQGIYTFRFLLGITRYEYFFGDGLTKFIQDIKLQTFANFAMVAAGASFVVGIYLLPWIFRKYARNNHQNT